MIGKSTIVWIALACTASGILYQTSYRVQEQEENLARLNRQIVAEQEAIQVLKAEWAYLNDPDRLEKLAGEYLVLQPTRAEQIVTLDEIPLKTPELVAELLPPESGRKPGRTAPAAAQVAQKGGAQSGPGPGRAVPDQVAENHTKAAPAAPSAALAKDAAPHTAPAVKPTAPVLMVNYGAGR